MQFWRHGLSGLRGGWKSGAVRGGVDRKFVLSRLTNRYVVAHAPFENYPQIIREAARKVGAIAQVAGGVPAMCDGVTQGQTGMELSLFSRDVIAMASAVGLSHDVFDAALHLGVCDKIVPGLEPWLDGDTLAWRDAPRESGNLDIVRPASDPFSADGGLRLMKGPIGRGVSKVSAVKPEHRLVEAPARVFDSQHAMKAAFEAGELDQDFIAVVRFQGPAANGMPELHSLTPVLGVLQDRGHKVALVTDGRMSGASGKVPSAIHVGPEAARGGPIARIRDGDIIRLNANTGELTTDADLTSRDVAVFRPNENQIGLGRELFSLFRAGASDAESGASPFSLTGTRND
ncbi:UNVERIFIED_CONTAM: hypothetical protein GTU68_053474 [Idotea baltica]|nr:hypothetical protein [Idotea baltica]